MASKQSWVMEAQCSTTNLRSFRNSIRNHLSNRNRKGFISTSRINLTPKNCARWPLITFSCTNRSNTTPLWGPIRYDDLHAARMTKWEVLRLFHWRSGQTKATPWKTWTSQRTSWRCGTLKFSRAIYWVIAHCRKIPMRAARVVKNPSSLSFQSKMV